MSSQYFPSQPPAHILQLSIQHINITKSSDSPTPPTSEAASASSPPIPAPLYAPQFPQRQHPKTDEAREKSIQAEFKNNLSQHQASHLEKYGGKELISYAELQERQCPKAQLSADRYFYAKALSGKSKSRATQARHEVVSNRTKGAQARKKGLSSHRRGAAGDGGDGDE